MTSPVRDPLPDRTDDVFLKDLLDSVNVFRARHGVAPLTLDPDLVRYAKNRAQVASTYEGLAEGHAGNKGSGYGENMSWQGTMSGEPGPTTEATSGWYSEIVDYNFADAKGFDTRFATGHFTQLVWKGSTKFGAARAFGKSPGSQFDETYIVANFSPGGNMAGDYAANVVTPTQGQDNDATLRWTSFDGTTWSPVALLSDHESTHGPAAAMFTNFGTETLYGVYRHTDATLRYTTWATGTPIPHGSAAAALGLAVYQDKLYCAHHDTSDAQLQYTSFDGMSWTEAARIGGQAGAGPALAVYQDKLFCAHRGPNTDARIWFTTFDGTAWATDTPIPTTNCETPVIPALAAYQGKLYCAHRGNTDAYVRCTSFDGTSWSTDNRISDIPTASGPALAVYQDKLYCAYRGAANNLRYLTYDGTTWTTPATIPNATTTKNPALAVHHNRLYCLYRK